MAKTYTVADAQAYIAQHLDGIMRAYRDADLPAWARFPKMEDIVKAGAWLGEMLLDHGATPEIKSRICFAHCQRCLLGDPYEWAVCYLNEFIANGVGLADQINDEVPPAQRDPRRN